jgi:L-asparaginase II
VPHEVLVTLTRGPLPESHHRGAYCVVKDGRVLRSRGDVDVPVFYRSAAKPIQALAVVESGAPERFGFTEEELAMVVGSHDGSPRHAANAASMLRKIGVGPELLKCGGHTPLSPSVHAQYVREGFRWGRLEDNCSGKHSGMIAAAKAWGEDPARYFDRESRIQRENVANVALLAGVPAERIGVGVDGCGVPCFAVPVAGMARAAARLATPEGLPGPKAAAAARIWDAVMANPEMIAGPGRLDTRLIRAGAGRILSKEGAEAVHVLSVRGEGLGIALKIDDGASRASQAVMAALLLELGVVSAKDVLGVFPRAVVDREGSPVGEVRVAL